ncbi:MAG: trypsin-like peptidase domain-containing protein [Halioglobus sp.]|nr:trypsin-like peptidase domain-containing protein [Halioglobus sp.]
MKIVRHLHLISPSVLALILALLATGTASADTDTRKVRAPDGPAWLYAIAKLEIPGSRYADGRRQHHLETCSATLLADSTGGGRPLLLTAWHCLEFYNDLSRPLRVSIATSRGEALQREAYRLADGGGMHADWALLTLQGGLPDLPLARLALAPNPADLKIPVTMAGYSRDTGLGRRGAELTYDPGCRITQRQKHHTATDCRAHKGASGGAVVQLDAAGRSYLAGVISEGDGAGYSGFVPVTRFRAAVTAHQR